MEENMIDENVVDFKEFGVKIDLREIENMDKDEIDRCIKKIEKIKEILDKK